jgi:hypothetical protein
MRGVIPKIQFGAQMGFSSFNSFATSQHTIHQKGLGSTHTLNLGKKKVCGCEHTGVNFAKKCSQGETQPNRVAALEELNKFRTEKMEENFQDSNCAKSV